jgi:hypothetical protein
LWGGGGPWWDPPPRRQATVRVLAWGAVAMAPAGIGALVGSVA